MDRLTDERLLEIIRGTGDAEDFDFGDIVTVLDAQLIQDLEWMIEWIEENDIGDKFGNIYIPKSRYQSLKDKLKGG